MPAFLFQGGFHRRIGAQRVRPAGLLKRRRRIGLDASRKTTLSCEIMSRSGLQDSGSFSARIRPSRTSTTKAVQRRISATAAPVPAKLGISSTGKSRSTVIVEILECFEHGSLPRAARPGDDDEFRRTTARHDFFAFLDSFRTEPRTSAASFTG